MERRSSSCSEPLHFIPITIHQSEVSDRSFCYHTVIPKQQHTSRSKTRTPSSALLFSSGRRTPPCASHRKAVCNPLGVNYKTFSPQRLGGTWKCINLDSSLQSRGSFEETPVVSPRRRRDLAAGERREGGRKEKVPVYSALAPGRRPPRRASQSFTLHHLYFSVC